LLLLFRSAIWLSVSMRIVVIGGYGNFGARVCRALVGHADVELTALGRHPEHAPPDIADDSRIQKIRLDVASADFPEALRRLTPQIVIHCAGPFQGQSYRVVAASLTAGAHYLDLADGRMFVAHFAERNNAAARSAERLAVSGASTLPALSSAVVDNLADRFNRLQEIELVIAPAQRAPRGAATVAGVFSYAGKPFRWLSDGDWVTAFGWQELRRAHISGVGSRWAAACDVPDLELFPVRYPSVETVEFRAALEVGFQHAALWGAAMLRRVGLPFRIERCAAQLDRLASLFDGLGTERGGMLVSLKGIGQDGRKMRVDWSLIADDNHGPEIPCMAAVLLAKKLVRSEITMRGAMPCLGLLTLAEFEPEFARWGMSTAIQEIYA
jgi:NAD(P)-dependent dehydrogenase (short-subunit alcohol dehydrogenase family)